MRAPYMVCCVRLMRWATTSWTQVLAARDAPSSESRQALETLCRAYWYPIYVFVRGQGFDPDAARDLTQAYFALLIEKGYLEDFDPSRGRFRVFLRASVKHFLSKEREKGRAWKRGGHTQIGKVLSHTRHESEKKKVQALVFVGDAMEEAIDDLAAAAGALGLLGIPAFVFQEGHDPVAEQAYREIARLSRGAYGRFDPGAAHELGELLRAAAAYAAGGMRALADLSAKRNTGAMRLLEQMK